MDSSSPDLPSTRPVHLLETKVREAQQVVGKHTVFSPPQQGRESKGLTEATSTFGGRGRWKGIVAKLFVSLRGARRLMGTARPSRLRLGQNLSIRRWVQPGHQVTQCTRTSSSEVGACSDAVELGGRDPLVLPLLCGELGRKL